MLGGRCDWALSAICSKSACVSAIPREVVCFLFSLLHRNALFMVPEIKGYDSWLRRGFRFWSELVLVTVMRGWVISMGIQLLIEGERGASFYWALSGTRHCVDACLWNPHNHARAVGNYHPLQSERKCWSSYTLDRMTTQISWERHLYFKINDRKKKYVCLYIHRHIFFASLQHPPLTTIILKGKPAEAKQRTAGISWATILYITWKGSNQPTCPPK